MKAETKKLSRKAEAQITAIVAAHKRWPDLDATTLVARLPMTRAEALATFRLHSDEIGRRIGRKVTYHPASYAKTGNGAFGRYGRAIGGYSAPSVYFDNVPGEE